MLRLINVFPKFNQIINSVGVLNVNSVNYRINFANFSSTSEEQTDQKDNVDTPATREKAKAKDDKDRSRIIPPETSIRYLKSPAYQETYGKYLVWEQYRRNHKGLYPPRKTRKTCIRKGVISTGNPCPICRDEYLVLDYRNIELLKQFISPQSGKLLSYSKTGLCQRRHQELLVAIEKAYDYGLLTFDVPFRKFDYSEFYKEIPKQDS